MTTTLIRPARAGEAATLTALCEASKAAWGYDACFMALSREALTISESDIAMGGVFVAEMDGAVLGVAAIVQLDEAGAFDLDKLFIGPERMRGGIGGRLLRHAAQAARSHGGTSLHILADPHARGFYERCGAVYQGEQASDVIQGRQLPCLALTLGS